MANLRFRSVMASSLLVVVALGLLLNFSSSIFNVYGVDTDSSTLQKIQTKTGAKTPQVGALSNQTESISVQSGSFLSPQGFQVVSNAFATATSIPDIFGTALAELGFPPILTGVAGIVVIALIWEVVSLLFGLRT